MKLIKEKIGLIVILLGTLSWSLTMFKSGLVYPFGMGFWGPNGHDGIWHIALANSLARSHLARLEMPVFAGEQLRNYHIGFDLLLASLYKVTGIPVVNLYFQILPLVMALLTGLLTYKFILLWKKSKSQALGATFFVYFAGSFGWVVTLIRSGEIAGESMFWSQQSISTLINPPFALSAVLLLVGLIMLLKLEKKFSIVDLLFTILIFGLLVQVKVYAGILGLGSLGLISLINLLKNKNFRLISVFAGSVVLSTVLFFPLNKSSSGLVVFQPFWFLETMMALSDRFGWQKFYEAMVTYKMAGVWTKGLIAYSAAFGIFLVGNMGTRILGIIEVSRARKIDSITLFLLSIISLGVIFPMLILQKGTPWNTIQFFYYSLLFSGILAGAAFGKWVEKFPNSRPKIILFLMVVLLTIPTSLSSLWYHYLPSRPPAKISKLELEALGFLQKQPDGIVLTYPYDKEAALKASANPPRPLYLYESTAYVSAYSAKPVFLEDEVNLDITGYDWKTRRQAVEDFLQSLDHEKVKDFLRSNSIKYVYWVKPQRATLGEGQLGMSKIFENNEVYIYKVD